MLNWKKISRGSWTRLNNSIANEGAVIASFQRWGEEKFATDPQQYPNGGEYLDKLFLMLKRKSKDVGIITAQQTSYYNLIFNRFVFVKEVASIRDKYSRNFKGGHRGLKEMSFGSLHVGSG